jgi:hypothetical protein
VDADLTTGQGTQGMFWFVIGKEQDIKIKDTGTKTKTDVLSFPLFKQFT